MNFETFAATRKGIRRYRLARDGSGVESELLATFIGCIATIVTEENGSLSFLIVARSCRRNRVVEIELTEKQFRTPAILHRELLRRGGIDFYIHSGNRAAICRALTLLSPADCAAAERELIGTAKPP